MVESVSSNNNNAAGNSAETGTISAGQANATTSQSGIDLINEAVAAVDLCKDAFTAYTDSNFKSCKE